MPLKEARLDKICGLCVNLTCGTHTAEPECKEDEDMMRTEWCESYERKV